MAYRPHAPYNVCVEPEEFFTYVTGKIQRSRAEWIFQHCLECEFCERSRQTAAWLATLDSFPVATLSATDTHCVLDAELYQWYMNVRPSAVISDNIQSHIDGGCERCLSRLKVIEFFFAHFKVATTSLEG